MSQFTDNATQRTEDITKFMIGLIRGEKGAELVKKYSMMTENYIPFAPAIMEEEEETNEDN